MGHRSHTHDKKDHDCVKQMHPLNVKDTDIIPPTKTKKQTLTAIPPDGENTDIIPPPTETSGSTRPVFLPCFRPVFPEGQLQPGGAFHDTSCPVMSPHVYHGLQAFYSSKTIQTLQNGAMDLCRVSPFYHGLCLKGKPWSCGHLFRKRVASH